MSQSPKTDQRSDETDQQPKQDKGPSYSMLLLALIAKMFPFLSEKQVVCLADHSARIYHQTYRSDVDVAELLLEMITKRRAAEELLAEANKKIEELNAQVAELQAPKTGNQKPNVPALPAKTFANIAKQQLPPSETLVKTVPQAGTWAAAAEEYDAEKAESKASSVKSDASSDELTWDVAGKSKPNILSHVNFESIVNITSDQGYANCRKCKSNHATASGYAFCDTREFNRRTITNVNGKVIEQTIFDETAYAKVCELEFKIFAGCSGFGCTARPVILSKIGDYAIILPYCADCLTKDNNTLLSSVSSKITLTEVGQQLMIRRIISCIESIRSHAQ